MSFEKALREELNKVIPDIFPLVAPEDTKPPYLVYVSSYGDRDLTLEGYLETKEIKCELHIVTNNYSDLKSLTKSVIDSVVVFQGVNIGSDQVYIQELTYEKPIEMYEKETQLYHSIFDINARL